MSSNLSISKNLQNQSVNNSSVVNSNQLIIAGVDYSQSFTVDSTYNVTFMKDVTITGKLLISDNIALNTTSLALNDTEGNCLSLNTGSTNKWSFYTNPTSSALSLKGWTGSAYTSDLYYFTNNGIFWCSALATYSDYRIKDNIMDLSGLTIDALRPVQYHNKITEKQDFGFIAHEVQEIFPNLVEGEKDGLAYQSLNYSGIIAILVKEIQELKSRVKDLEKINK